MLKFTFETVRRVVKVMSVMFLLIPFVMVAEAQVGDEDCPSFKVTVEAFDAACYQSGTVKFTLKDQIGNLFSIADSDYTDVRLYIVKGGTDTSFTYCMFQDGVAVMTNVDTGDLVVGIEAFCNRTHFNRRVAWDTNVRIDLLYQVPTASALNKLARTDNGFGSRPSLNCDSTGRVQLKVTGGTFPYTVKVTQHGDTTAVLKTVTFTEPQTGQDSLLYNYKDYYTIDSLPPGDWDFYLVDGCGYGLPRTGQIVESINFPRLDYLEVYASSGNFADSNVVKINAVIDQQFDYYTKKLSEYVQYRFIIGDTTASDVPWKVFPSFTGTNKVLLYDTVDGVHDYCELWDRDITLQYRVNTCNDTLISRTFQYHKPNENNFQKNTTIVTDETIFTGACLSTTIEHTSAFTIRYNPYNPNNIRKNQDDDIHRYHYTHPLVWTYSDVNGSVLTEIKTDTVANISTTSTLSESEIRDFYEWSDICSKTIHLNRTLRDGHGCEIYTTTDELIIICDTNSSGPSWQVTQSGNDHCCTELRTVKLSEINSANNDPDGTIVHLINSPYNNRYGFTATFNRDERNWTVEKENLENVALIYGYGNGRELEISDYCLPSGPYTFEVISSCGRDTVTRYVSFPDIYSTELTELPAYTMEQQCTDMYITYTEGTVSRVSRNTDSHTGQENPPVEQHLETNFSIISGPLGGYDEGRKYVKNQPIRISVPGDYIIHIFPNENQASGLCEVPDFYDTIHYSGATVQYEFAYAFLCDETDTEGTAYVKAFNGTPPYTYVLFSGPDKTGDTLGVQVLPADSIASFDTLMNAQSTLSCFIMDACGAYFHINFIPRTLAQMNKIWFEDGSQVSTTCEGFDVQVHALAIGNILNYKWYDPYDNLIDSVSSPSFFIERGAPSGYYKVEIEQNSCHALIRDSVLLNVDIAPTLKIGEDVVVCPGEEAELFFVPNSSYLESLSSDSLIHFRVAFENGNGIEIREYAALSGDTVVDHFVTNTPAKIYPLSIFDQRCDYTIADDPDTVFIDMVASEDLRCTMQTTHDTVCYGGTGHLTARNTTEPPYVIHWYGDYGLTQWLKDDTIMDDRFSEYDTAGLTQCTILYVSIEKEGMCPSVNGVTYGSMNLHNDTTELLCGQSVRLYDSGGRDGNYQPGQVVKQTFHTTDGLPVTLKFDELDLSQSSHLFVISGSRLHPDSVLFDFSYGSVPPEIIVSRADTLTLYFMAGQMGAAGWSAIVEHEPGIAIADVWKPNRVTLKDQVCQSQSLTYDDPLGVVGTVVTADEVNQAIKRAGTYVFEKTFEGADSHNCDSTVIFRLTVNAPPRRDTTVISTSYHLSQNPLVWYGEQYDSTGQYTKVFSLEDGCDSIEVLSLVVIDVDVNDKDICVGETTSVDVLVTNPMLPWETGSASPRRAPGDVLCSDGSVLKPDSFLLSDKTAIGVVYFVESNGVNGKAIALVDCPEPIRWAINTATIYRKIHAASKVSNYKDIIYDMDGVANTKAILNSASSLTTTDLESYAPAAYFCNYYNPFTQSTDPGNERGWYLPAAGEFNILYGNRTIVNKTLSKLTDRGAQLLKNDYVYYLVSSEYNDDQCWHLDYSGHITYRQKGLSNSTYNGLPSYYYVRASIIF